MPRTRPKSVPQLTAATPVSPSVVWPDFRIIRPFERFLEPAGGAARTAPRMESRRPRFAAHGSPKRMWAGAASRVAREPLPRWQPQSGGADTDPSHTSAWPSAGDELPEPANQHRVLAVVHRHDDHRWAPDAATREPRAHVLLATLSTPGRSGGSVPVIAAARLREGAANSARGPGSWRDRERGQGAVARCEP